MFSISIEYRVTLNLGVYFLSKLTLLILLLYTPNILVYTYKITNNQYIQFTKQYITLEYY